MRELLIVVLVGVNALLTVQAARRFNSQFQSMMESVFIGNIEAENERKTREWLEEKKRYEPDAINGSSQ